jgi:hypothetical protein
MTTSAIASCIGLMIQKPAPTDFKISLAELEDFEKQYTWQALKHNNKLGKAFCLHFDITDYILFYTISIDQAKKYIRDNYLDVRGTGR